MADAVPLRYRLPNALTVARLVALPFFWVLLAGAPDGHSVAAGVLFAAASLTDWFDGYLARRLQLLDPLRPDGRPARRPPADRLGGAAPVVARPPAAGSCRVLILSRDIVLLVAQRAAAARGYELTVIYLGKAATAILMVGLGLIMVTPPDVALAGLRRRGRARALAARGRPLPRNRALAPAHRSQQGNLMRAVVMAGGEGTRLRPLTSNQPKPMVPICGKPCIEHIVELVHKHGIDDVVVTLAFMPQVIRSYLGDGSSLGVRIEYAVEEQPLGTAGSVRNAKELLDETFVVISGDALCDFDIGEIVAFHRERGALATLALKSVDNPLEFGVVIVDDEGRIERFLEKPSWGQVFSDTINTGVYVIEPELLDRIPEGEPYDFSKQLFPELLAEGAPLYGYVVPEDKYWKDIGTIEQYREANQDVLDGLVGVDVPGVRLKENIWLGEGVDAARRRRDRRAPRSSAPTRRSRRARPSGRTPCSGRTSRSRPARRCSARVIDGGTHIGSSAVVRGATVGRNCDLRARVRVDEGAALGDECVVGEEALIGPEVRVYPYKTIEAGAQIRQNLVWESRGVRSLFSRDGVVGTINVDVTPEVAVRLGMAFGTQLERGSTVVASRDGHPAARMITRAMISGLASTGVHVADLRIAWPALVRHHVRLERLAGRLPRARGAARSRERRDHVPRVVRAARGRRRAPRDRACLRPAGVPAGLGPGARAPELAARRPRALRRRRSWPRSTPSAVRSRAFRMVVDYGGSPASQAVPRVMGALGVEVIGLNAYADGASPLGSGNPASCGGTRGRRRRRPRSRARPVRRAGAADRRARRADLRLAAPAAARRARGASWARGSDRRARDRHRSRRGARRGLGPADPTDAGERRGPDRDRRHRRRAARRRRRRPRRTRRHAAGRRRARRGGAAARAVGARGSPAVGAGRRAARRSTSCTTTCTARGRPRAPSCAR